MLKRMLCLLEKQLLLVLPKALKLLSNSPGERNYIHLCITAHFHIYVRIEGQPWDYYGMYTCISLLSFLKFSTQVLKISRVLFQNLVRDMKDGDPQNHFLARDLQKHPHPLKRRATRPLHGVATIRLGVHEPFSPRATTSRRCKI